MKRLFFAFLSIFIAFSVFAQEENANIKKETRNIDNFSTLKVTKGINVTLIEGEEPGAEINIVNAPPSDVVIENDKNELTIKMRTRIYKDVSVQVYLTYKDIREITVGSGGSVDNQGVLATNTLILSTGLDAVIDLNVDVEELEASTSASRITMEGYAETVEAKATTGGKFQGQLLKTRKAFVTANTGGIATVNVSEQLEARAGTGGTVEYKGNPNKVETRETLGGKVGKID